jgi:hypothetical protein
VAGALTVQLQHTPEGNSDFADVGRPVPVAADGTVRIAIPLVEPGRYRFRWSPPAPASAVPAGLPGLLLPPPASAAAPVFASAVVSVAPG